MEVKGIQNIDDNRNTPPQIAHLEASHPDPALSSGLPPNFTIEIAIPPSSKTAQHPTLSMLPPEILQEITNQIDDYFDAMSLKRTNRHFYRFVHPSIPAFFEAESSWPAWSHHLLACKLCRRLRPMRKFADNTEMPFRRGRGLGEKPTRCCIECVINPKKGTLGYRLGCQITVGGETLVVCATCHGLKPGVDDFSPGFREKSGGESSERYQCRECWEGAGGVREC